jgi:hypothetical protein
VTASISSINAAILDRLNRSLERREVARARRNLRERNETLRLRKCGDRYNIVDGAGLVVSGSIVEVKAWIAGCAP